MTRRLRSTEMSGTGGKSKTSALACAVVVLLAACSNRSQARQDADAVIQRSTVACAVVDVFGDQTAVQYLVANRSSLSERELFKPPTGYLESPPGRFDIVYKGANPSAQGECTIYVDVAKDRDLPPWAIRLTVDCVRVPAG